MNIFILERDAQECAKAYQDRHLHWGVVDTATALYAAHVALDGKAPVESTWLARNPITGLAPTIDPYHGMFVWTRESWDNYDWMADLNDALVTEYRLRTGRPHTLTYVCRTLFEFVPVNGVRNHANGRNRVRNLTEFPQSLPTIYKGLDPIDSYRAYYMSKSRGANWSWPRTRPTWWMTAEECA